MPGVIQYLLVVGGILVGGTLLSRRSHGDPRWAHWPLVARSILLLLGVFAISLTGPLFLTWIEPDRPPPGEVGEALFEGVMYWRDVREQPRPLVIHVVKIDLNAPDLSFFVTPGDPDAPIRPFEARTTSAFLMEFGVQLAINGDCCTPWHDNGPLDYYPHAGDPVGVKGMAATGGDVIQVGNPDYPVLAINADNRVDIGEPPRDPYHVVAGKHMLVIRGESAIDEDEWPYWPDLHPRTAAAINAAGDTLMLFSVDGRQPGYSEGMTIPEMVALMLEYGAHDAINLDGGGSTTFVTEGEDGMPLVLNTPIHNHILNRERPIATHLGVIARPLDE